MADKIAGQLETILVVDDDVAVLWVVVKILQSAQFHTLHASSAEHAVELAASYDGIIHLLLSDVDMPRMNGPALGEALKKVRPDLHVMLMSGLAEGNLLVLNYGWAFIQKPFIPKVLVKMVKEVLGQPDQSQGSQGFDTRR